MNIVSSRKDSKLIVGGDPRVTLLPPEVAARAKAYSTRRALVGIVVVAALICGGGYGLASVAAAASADELTAEQDRTTALLRQQSEFLEVRFAQDQLEVATAARQVASATEIGWQSYLAQVNAALPAGSELTGVVVESSTPLVPLPEASVPLQGSRVATLIFTASSPVIPDIEAWLNALADLEAFVDATPGTIAYDEATSSYTTSMTMHIDSSAYANQFAPVTDVAATTEEDSE